MSEALDERGEEWHADYGNIFGLASWLYEHGEFTDMEEMLYYFEKPWKWTEKWEEYKNDPSI
jgi:hypothetical protein